MRLVNKDICVKCIDINEYYEEGPQTINICINCIQKGLGQLLTVKTR